MVAISTLLRSSDSTATPMATGTTSKSGETGASLFMRTMMFLPSSHYIITIT